MKAKICLLFALAFAACVLITGRPVLGAIVIETIRDEPLAAKLEQTRLAQREAGGRLTELLSEAESRRRELEDLRIRLKQYRDAQDDSKRWLAEWRRERLELQAKLGDAKDRGDRLREALKQPLADLALAQSQGHSGTGILRLEAIVEVSLRELSELEVIERETSQALQNGRQRAEAAEAAEDEHNQRVPETEAAVEAVSAALLDVEADIALWNELTRQGASEVETLETVIAALEAEKELRISPLPASPPMLLTFRTARPWPKSGRQPPGSGNLDLVMMPVDGQVVSQFGESEAAPLDQGILIEAEGGSRIIAPKAGKVVFAGPFQRYGQLLIIDHGDGYHTLLSGFDWLGVEEQTNVVAGQLIGSLAIGNEANSRLYFELRRRGKPANPLPWLAAREDRNRG